MANVLVEKLADRLRVKREGGTNGSCSPAEATTEASLFFPVELVGAGGRRKEGGTVGVGGKKRSRGKREAIGRRMWNSRYRSRIRCHGRGGRTSPLRLGQSRCAGQWEAVFYSAEIKGLAGKGGSRRVCEGFQIYQN